MTTLSVHMNHDATIAFVRDGVLIFSIEIEKLNNNERYSDIQALLGRRYEDCPDFPDIILSEALRLARSVDAVPDKIDRIVLSTYKELESPDHSIMEIITGSAAKTRFVVAPYGAHRATDLLRRYESGTLPSGIQVSTYSHLGIHAASAYCTSPFAAAGEESFILIWDGGCYPELTYYSPKRGLERLGLLFPVPGSIYVWFPTFFAPFEGARSFHLSIAGKAMALCGLGKCDPTLLRKFRATHDDLERWRGAEEFGQLMLPIWASAIAMVAKSSGAEAGDALATFHELLAVLLLERMESKIAEFPGRARNLCFVGGSALNIKWNSRLRQSGLFDHVWVPPFPNDSGCAIGACCAEMLSQDSIHSLNWNVYSGPPIVGSCPVSGWQGRSASVRELARLLAEEKEPVVVLNGRAELGPRALGNRSIFAPPLEPAMKDRLNRIKGREFYRPVAPICLEEDAKEIFDPGVADPYMLFDHVVRKDWANRIPAVLHVDGTARLQTVNREQNPTVHELISAYKEFTGIPLLCNTSANLAGRGFFPDVKTATEWGGTKYVWSAGRLFSRS